ncbi:MAG: DUF6580 family putative transport protein [Woeseiaceae bacterium]
MKIIVFALATVLHLVPRPFGVSPVGALSLYSGAFGSRRFFWALPFIPLTIAAFLFGFYDPTVMVFVYAGFALATFAGNRFLSGRRGLADYAAAIGSGAVAFYLVSNIGNWLAFYPRTPAALVECYVNGLPFLLQATIADAFFCYVLFGLHQVLERTRKEPVTA